MATETLVDLLDRSADAQPDHEQYTVLGRASAVTLTPSAVRSAATALADALTTAGHPPGARMLLVAPSPAAFIAGFFGACLGGYVPVPVAPPGRSRLERGLGPIRAIAADCTPAGVLTTEAIHRRLTDALDHDDPLHALAWESIERLVATSTRATTPRATTSADDVAYLQYTSGSTSLPKGVRITHRAALANLATIDAAFRNSPTDHGMIWLPTHHDMGLLGGVLAPMFSQMTVTLATPQQFLQSPVRWLQWITESGATISGGPDFAYRLCAERVRDDQMEGLDLSRWRLAFTGAEAIRADTLDLFTEKFASVGFRREAFYPCYGLAEATLMVTGTDARTAPRALTVDRSALSRGSVEPPDQPTDTRTLVACGKGVTAEDHIAVVDPHTHCRLTDDTVGEIWYSGPSVGDGYHGRAKTSTEVFGACIAGEEPRRWLRTGDLGFLRNGELFVTGRMRDTIVIRGRNLDAVDINDALQSVLSVPRLGMVAALNPVRDDEEHLVIAIEAGRGALDLADEATATVQAELAGRFGVRAHEVIFVRSGSLPRTTSGKLKRTAAVEAYELGFLDTLAPSTREGVA